jgi:hypothetical protein
MKKAPFVLFIILVVSLFNSISSAKAPTSRDINVGVFYYPWYAKGYGNGHWGGNATKCDSSLPATWWTVVDRPTLDWYASNDTTIIKRHLDWFAYAGIDFGIISWWGPNSFEESQTDTLFNVTDNYAPWFRWVISIEGGQPENWQLWRNWTYENYTKKYHNIWLNDTEKNKPFLFWMNSNITNNSSTRASIKEDLDFSVSILGQADYSDWKTWTPYTYGGATSAFPPSMNEFMCVMPRYDETRLDPNGIKDQPRNRCADRDLDGSVVENCDPLNGTPLYDKQWNEVLSNASASTRNVNYVAIATWNDFTERTQIEPCYDLTSAYLGNTTYLLDKTKEWIFKLHESVHDRNLKIDSVSREPNASVAPMQEVIVHANITDSNNNVEKVWVRYILNTTDDWAWTQMLFEASSGSYEAAIPGQADNVLVTFTIIATDNANNCLIDSNYTYVVPEFPSTLVLLPFMLATLVAVAVHTRKKRALSSHNAS